MTNYRDYHKEVSDLAREGSEVLLDRMEKGYKMVEAETNENQKGLQQILYHRLSRHYRALALCIELLEFVED